MSSGNQQPVSVETVKTTLKSYSRFMRRDFLAILVKMSAKNFNVRTVRCDWRTRSGMLAFMQGVWERFFPLLSQDTIFKWYCQNFDTQEKVFSNRKFMMYIFANWQAHQSFLKQEETLTFLKVNQNEAEILLSNPKAKHSQAWAQPIGTKFLEIINEFASSKPAQVNSSPVPLAAPSIMRKSMSMPSMQQIAAQPQIPPRMASSPIEQAPQPDFIAQPIDFFQVNDPVADDFSTDSYSTAQSVAPNASYDSDISSEDLFDPINFELGEYNPQEFPVVFPMDYPYSIDLYTL